MWKPSQDVKDGVEPDDSKCYDRPSQRRRWDAFSDPKLLPPHLEYSPPRPSRWDVSAQVSSESRQQQPPTLCLESKSSSSGPLRLDVSTQVPSESKPRPSHFVDLHSTLSQPSRIAGGNGCHCCPSPRERPLQKNVDFCDAQGHLPAGYRNFVEHDDLYLPPARALSPMSTDHDDLYLPLRTNEDSPGDCCPCDLRMCDSDPTYGDIYLPPSRPCTPAFPKDPCGYQPPCPPPCRPSPPRPGPPSGQPSCGPKMVCSCPPYIKKLAPCPTPPSEDCSCSPYIKKLSGCSPPPSSPPSRPPSSPPSRPPSTPPAPSCRPYCCPPVQQCSSVCVDEVPSPPGIRYKACKKCLCHKDIRTRSLSCSPKKISPCRDCVCHLGARSPSQGVPGCPPKGAHARCQAGFQSPGKPRLKIKVNQSAQCLECKSPHNCKGPPNCNPHYIVEMPLSPSSARVRSPSPGLSPRSPMGAGNCSGGPPPSSRCPSGDGGSSGGSPKVSPKLFEDPCCSPCRPVPGGRPLLAAELLSGMEACVSRAKACGGSTASCMDPGWGGCEPKCPPSPPSAPCSRPSPPPCRSVPSSSPRRLADPSCSSFGDDVHNPAFKTFESTSPRCKDCDCHKPKNCKLSLQICKFCRGAGWCYCEYHTTQQFLSDSNSEPQTTPEHDKNCMKVEEAVVSQVSGTSPEITCRSSDLSARIAKVEFNGSSRDEEMEQIPRSSMNDLLPQSDITQRCCCGKCEYTKPQCPIKTECPFCKHTHSCCCGMCSCPIPTCSSKAPLDGPTPLGLSVNSSGASTGRNNSPLYSHRPKLVSQIAPRKKLGLASPDKSTSKPFTTSNSRVSSARSCYCSPKTRTRRSPSRR